MLELGGACLSSALTFSIIAEAHLGLSKPDCVFPLTDAIKFLELSLVNTLREAFVSTPGQDLIHQTANASYLAWKINFNGLNANVLRAGRHRVLGGGEVSRGIDCSECENNRSVAMICSV